ncbi:hypothetical protein OHA70_07960 [Kribbella sp. NBC_00382]|uniref:hypothetical protein n=1 Tax=Kribbella sp. NBC_00382 TaxID=2975967 RepID=UPI002E1A2FE2
MTSAADEWFLDGRYYTTTVFSEGSTRDGLGWELEDIAPAPGRGKAMEVFRYDSAAVPIISCSTFLPVPPEAVDQLTRKAVPDLLYDVLSQERTSRLAPDIAQALALTGRTVLRWSDPEWPIVEAVDSQQPHHDGELPTGLIEWVKVVVNDDPVPGEVTLGIGDRPVAFQLKWSE